MSLGATPLEQQPPAGPTPTPRPAPAEDRVGFPEGYQSDYQTFFVMDRPDNKQVRVIYANDKAAAASPGNFPYGSILVMETWRAVEDEGGNVVLDDSGRYQRDTLTGIFVMRKESGFGAAYEMNRSGEWEYVAFRPDKTYSTTARNSAPCSVCHTDAGGSRDWVFRGNLYFDQASGAVPTAPPGLAATGRIPMQQYSFLPSEITVRAGTTVTWSNEDEAVHTVTAADKSWDSGRIPIGGSFSQMFTAPGTYEFVCTIHAAM
ncbi:MAG TPA: cytochrome P460 family protein, partial [Chloroflexota bacterium]